MKMNEVASLVLFCEFGWSDQLHEQWVVDRKDPAERERA